MKTLLIVLTSIVVIILVIFLVLKPSSTSQTSTLSLTEANNNQVINASMGETIKVTLRNPGDGGYQFADPIYDKNILSLINKTHTNSQTGLTGDFGSDVWTYKTIKLGNTQLTYEIYRPWDQNDRSAVLSVTVNVK